MGLLINVTTYSSTTTPYFFENIKWFGIHELYQIFGGRHDRVAPGIKAVRQLVSVQSRTVPVKTTPPARSQNGGDFTTVLK